MQTLSRSSFLIVSACAHATLVAGCVGDTPIKGEDTGDSVECDSRTVVEAGEIQSDTSVSGYACRADFDYHEGCHDKVYGVRVKGSADVPSSVKIVSPGACGGSGYTDTTPDGSWVSEAGNESACPDVDNHTHALECNYEADARSEAWKVYLPSHASGCSAWGNLDLTFLLPSEDECDPPADTPHNVCSSADDAPAFFVHRNSFELDGDDSIHTHILPLLENDTDHYSERAWLREISVTDWGDATKLYVLKKGYGIHYNGDDVVEDSSVVVLDSQNSSATFNEGDVFMGTTFAMNSFDRSDTSVEPPSVTFDWTCGVPNPPHFQEIGGLPPAYAIRIEDLGIQGVDVGHRVKMRLFTGGGFMTLELEGRYHDAISIPIQASGNDWTFNYADGGSIGIDAAGTISSSGNNKVVDFDSLVLRGHDLGTPTWTLTPFSED